MQASDALKEAYGAKIQKPPEVSAARLRATNLKEKHRKESERPPKRYTAGQIVYVTIDYVPFTNGLIVGTEWGPDSFHKSSYGGRGWAYWIRDCSLPEGSQAFLVAESRISDRISV